MSIETELRTRLVADGTVTGLVGSRIYALKLPQDPTLPAVTYQRISGPRIHRLSGTSGWGRARIQYDSWAETYVGVQALAAAVRASLNGFLGTLTTLEASIRLDNERDLYEDEVEIYRITQDYIVLHTET